MKDIMIIYIVRVGEYNGINMGYFTNREAAEECEEFFNKLDPYGYCCIVEEEVQQTFNPNNYCTEVKGEITFNTNNK
jgi:hypothetical protein